MQMIKCANGHWFDMEKTKSCPYCRTEEEKKKSLQKNIGEVDRYQVTFDQLHEGVTMPMRPSESGGTIRLGPGGGAIAGISASKDPITVGIVSKARGNAFITGWLVGRNGQVKGRDYRLSFGMNFIGSGWNVDVCISEDPKISAKHCSIAYDVKSNGFFIVAEQGSITYLNGELLMGSAPLVLGDEIGMGDSSFEFVPFCREGHTWDVEE